MVITGHLISQNHWEPLQSPVSENLQAVWITDTNHFYVVSNQGSLLTSEDGGQTWNIQSFPGNSFTDICFTDTLHGAIIGNGSNVSAFFTQDGKTWQNLSPDSLNTGNAIFFNQPR